MDIKRKDLLSLSDLSVYEMDLVLQTAASFKQVSARDIKKVPTLRGKTVVNLFFEPSTRTRTSFELAAKRLSADVINFQTASSSMSKGETLLDTARTIEAMRADMIVVRHASSGAPHLLARSLKSAVINAGDGMHEHPSQGLLDLFTVWEKKGTLRGLKVLIVGDILHSRVAHSDIHGFQKYGCDLHLVGPPSMVPSGLLGTVHHRLETALPGADVVILLRLQRERQSTGFFTSLREYAKLYGLTAERLACAHKDVLVMHPGPINRGVELTSEVADGSASAILDQVSHGVAVRMAILYLLSGGTRRRDA